MAADLRNEPLALPGWLQQVQLHDRVSRTYSHPACIKLVDEQQFFGSPYLAGDSIVHFLPSHMTLCPSFRLKIRQHYLAGDQKKQLQMRFQVIEANGEVIPKETKWGYNPKEFAYDYMEDHWEFETRQVDMQIDLMNEDEVATLLFGARHGKRV